MKMYEYLPLLIMGAVIGLFTAFFIAAYWALKRKKEVIGFDRHMKDGQIIKRLLHYAKPYRMQFVLVFVIMLVSIVYDVVSPLLVGHIEKVVAGEFEL